MTKQLDLGMMIGYWGAGPPVGTPELIAEAERLGFRSVWTAEAYGSDALTPLAWWGAQTSQIQLGTSISPPARLHRSPRSSSPCTATRCASTA